MKMILDESTPQKLRLLIDDRHTVVTNCFQPFATQILLQRKKLLSQAVVRIAHASHYIFRSNEAEVIRKLNSDLALPRVNQPVLVRRNGLETHPVTALKKIPNQL